MRPVRLIHLLNGLEVGGKERVMLQLARRARREGFDVRVVVFETVFRDEARDLDPGDLPVHHIPRGGGLDLAFLRRLARYLEDEGIDVVHAHNDTALFYAACAARLVPHGRRPRVCGTFHTRPSHPTWRARLLTRWTSRWADDVIAVSPDLEEFLLEAGWSAHCRTVWNGVDLEEYRPDGPRDGWRERLGVPADALLVGHIARFDPIKRHVDLVDAAERVARELPGVHFVCVGQGPEREAIEERAGDLPGLHFVPRVVDVPAFLRCLDVFVLPSREECAPLVVLEAMACGLPCVTTDVGGLRRMLLPADDEPSGLLVPALDPGALADGLLEVLRDAELRSELGGRARARVDAFSAEREWRAYAEAYAGSSNGA